MKHAFQDNPKAKSKASKKNAVAGEFAESKNDLIYRALDVFKEKMDFLHWTDVVAFGSVNRECRNMYLTQRDSILQPLLGQLESMVGSNFHCWACGKVYAPISKRICTCASEPDIHVFGWHPENQALVQLDPRYVDSYEALTSPEKCAKMVHFLSTIVSNMRQQFHFDDFSNPNNLPSAIGHPHNWSLGDGVDGNALLEIYPRRASLALNIATLAFAGGAMKSGDDIYFNEAFLGNGSIDPSGSTFWVTIADMITEMLPFRNRDLVIFLNGIYPSLDVLALLGPMLVSKVVLCAPAFDLVPPSKEYGDIVKLPPGLERISKKVLLQVFGTLDLP